MDDGQDAMSGGGQAGRQRGRGRGFASGGQEREEARTARPKQAEKQFGQP